nr:immunoglobulin light chain junction region [Macaca mulatta]MOW16757.1 immunoglobulin light chain junction region [Macaca mulatta]MOW17972.1 immunoglobulin light chain junction region [Macaca mulatta]
DYYCVIWHSSASGFF